MTQSGTMSGTDQSRYDGTDYICKTCGCEIMVKHRGDEAKGYGRGDYICSCGTTMQLEHPESQGTPEAQGSPTV